MRHDVDLQLLEARAIRDREDNLVSTPQCCDFYMMSIFELRRHREPNTICNTRNRTRARRLDLHPQSLRQQRTNKIAHVVHERFTA